MELHHPTAEIYVPDGKPVGGGVAAHHASRHRRAPGRSGIHGVPRHLASATRSKTKWFGGVTCTNGSGSARTGKYETFSDEQMMAVRRREQNRAAKIGKYGVMIQLDFPSSAVKSPTDTALAEDLKQILAATRPEIVYTHNLADKHDTHVGVVVAAIQAMRELPRAQRPKPGHRLRGVAQPRLAGAMPTKVVMDVSGHDQLAARLNGVFASQIAGGNVTIWPRWDGARPTRPFSIRTRRTRRHN